VAAFLGTALAFLAISAFFAWRFTSPVRRPLGDQPEKYLANHETVGFKARDGVPLTGWFAPAGETRRAVILLHGNGATRTQVLARAGFFQTLGHATLLYDARGHGQSGGNLVSFGWFETADLLGALDWLRGRGFGEVGCLGVSQGGATIALAAANLSELRWAILESVYPTLPNAVDRRFRAVFGIAGSVLGSAMVPIAEWRLGVRASGIAPREYVHALACPVLAITGEADRHTFSADAREVFEQIRSPKRWEVITGAGHVDLYGHARERYEAVVREFLASMP
jgi:uncharacterized protein